MFQQIIAFIVILCFLVRLILQKRGQKINMNEFLLWLIFWGLAAASIVLIRHIDDFVARIGFSSRGIDVLLYLAVVILFYLVFKYRLKLAKIEKEITQIIRDRAINNKE